MQSLYKSLISGFLFESDHQDQNKKIFTFYSEYRSVLFNLKNRQISPESRNFFAVAKDRYRQMSVTPSISEDPILEITQ